MSDSKKNNGVMLTVMGTVLAILLAAFLGIAISTSADQSDHETDKEAHGIDGIAVDIRDISNNVQTIMIQQGVQAETMKNMAEDIAELKE